MYCVEFATALHVTNNYVEKQKVAEQLLACLDNVKFYDSEFHSVIVQLVLADIQRQGIELENLLFFYLNQDRLRLVRRDFNLADIVACLKKYVEENPQTEFSKKLRLGAASKHELEQRLKVFVAESAARHLLHMQACLEARKNYRITVPDLRELARLVPSIISATAGGRKSRRKASRE